MLRVLGPLEIAADGGSPVALGAPKVRILLAALAIGRGAVQSSDVLIDALWDAEPPASAHKLLQVYISKLRPLLPDAVRLVTMPTGYVLEIQDEALDAAVFERLVADGRDALESGNPALAASLLRRALALWRGPAYADVRYRDFAQEEIARLDALRSLALVERIDADLRLGRHSECLGELRAMQSAEPTDERVAALAMLSAYRAVGSTEALEIFAIVQAAMGEELDEDVSPELVVLRDRIARRDPALATAAEEPSVSPIRLPVPPNQLIGRRAELEALGALLARPGVRLISLTGAGGSGKSRLALELAHEVESTFANGAILVELASVVEPGLMLPTIAHALDVEPGADALAALTQAVANREILLVLDNVEQLRVAAPDLVRLIAAAPRVVLVVTSRVVLHVSGEHVFPVAPLAEPDAVALFAARARAADPTFVLDASSEPIVAAICERLDGLPLPIELASARVRGLGLRTLEERLASPLAVLTGGPRDLPARQRTLRTMIGWSVDLLEPDERDVLAALAVFPAGCSLEGAIAVAGADVESIGSLVDHHLVQTADVGGERRYRLLETVREHAYELLGPRRESVEQRLVDWMLEIVGGIDLTLDAGPQSPSIRRLDVELDALRDALRHAADDPDPTSEVTLAAGVWRYWWIRGHLVEGRAIVDDILRRRGTVATPAGVRVIRAAGSLAWSLGDMSGAAALAERALAVATDIGDVLEQQAAHNLLGAIANKSDRYSEAERHLTHAITLARSLGRDDLALTASVNLGGTYLECGRLDEARALYLEVLEARQRDGLTEGVGFAHLNLGAVEFDAGALDRAEQHFSAAADAFEAVGFTTKVASALQGLAAVEAHTGRAESAARRLGTAATLLRDTGWKADGMAHGPLAIEAARATLGDADFERLFAEGSTSGPVAEGGPR